MVALLASISLTKDFPMPIDRLLLHVVLSLALALPAAPVIAADRLPALAADPSATTVSGLSSGAYMAGQFHVAFSGSVVGAAIVAGGPYDCATGSVAFALHRCMDTALGRPDPAALLARAAARAATGEIDPLANLADDRVYVFSGTEDHTVTPAVVATVPDFYRLAGVPAERIAVVPTMAAGHAFITEAFGNACATSDPDFVNDCDYDQAGAILGQLYPGGRPAAAVPSGRIVAFDQAEFLPDPTAHGLALTGYAYVPPACDAGGCRIHVVFHGCRQTSAMAGRAVIEGVGFNRWADTNRLIVLYPQTAVSSGNPRACWDWWGYDDARYATRAGRQMAAVHSMLDRLAATTPPPPEPETCARFQGTNFAHWQAGRARACDWWFVCAVGSGETLGFPVGVTTLYEHPGGTFSTAACAL